jgi:hypothetical protein
MFKVKKPIIDIPIGNKSIIELFSDWFNHYVEIMAENVSDEYGIKKEDLERTIQDTLDGTDPPQTLIIFQTTQTQTQGRAPEPAGT